MPDKKIPIDLKELNVDEKREIVKLFQKKELLQQENKLANFKPNPPLPDGSLSMQEKFLKSQAKIRFAASGNAAGKSTALIIDLLWTHLGIHPHRETGNVHHSWLLLPSYNKAEDMYNEIKKWCPISDLPKIDKLGSSDIRRFRWKNGSITTIWSHETDSSKLEGSNIDYLACDEIPPRSHWIAAFRGLRSNEHYSVTIAATPISGSWMYQELWVPWSLGQDTRIEVFQGSSYENPHIPKSWLEDWIKRLTPEEQAVRIYGNFAILEGRIYKQFKRDTHIIPQQEWPKDWPVYVAVDPHPRKAHCALAVGVTPEDQYVVLDEIEEPGEINDLAEKLLQWKTKWRVESMVIDNSGSSLDWTRNSAVRILADNNVYVTPVRRADKDVEAGINRIKQLLKGIKNKEGEWIPSLKIMNNCRRTITEFEMYSWKEAKNPEQTGNPEQPRKVYDEFLDCLRYIVNRTPEFQADLEIDSYLLSNNPYQRS